MRCQIHAVAPLVGAWIEREEKVREAFGGKVAPLVGAWIERYPPNSFNHLCFVAPLVGAWIERIDRWKYPTVWGRSSCRSVD